MNMYLVIYIYLQEINTTIHTSLSNSTSSELTLESFVPIFSLATCLAMFKYLFIFSPLKKKKKKKALSLNKDTNGKWTKKTMEVCD